MLALSYRRVEVLFETEFERNARLNPVDFVCEANFCATGESGTALTHHRHVDNLVAIDANVKAAMCEDVHGRGRVHDVLVTLHAELFAVVANITPDRKIINVLGKRSKENGLCYSKEDIGSAYHLVPVMVAHRIRKRLILVFSQRYRAVLTLWSFSYTHIHATSVSDR